MILRKHGCAVPGAGVSSSPHWLSQRPTGAGSRTPADAPLPSGMVCWERKMTTGLFLLGLKCAGDITNVTGLDTDYVGKMRHWTYCWTRVGKIKPF